MPFQPRFLQVEDEAQARRELLAVGVAPSRADTLAAKVVRRMVKLSGVPCEASRILQRKLVELGGDIAMARGADVCAVDETDLILIGSSVQLKQLCQRLSGQPFGLTALGTELGIGVQAYDQPPAYLRGRNCRLGLNRPLIMGILNLTPDSFSDGGCYNTLEAALSRTREMAKEGADLIDVGGESTRPGALPVSAQEELDRVIPVIEALQRETDLPLSVDTSKSIVAAEAVAAGAEFINDISGLRFDSKMAETAAKCGAGVFVMHTRGRPAGMQLDTGYDDLVQEILHSLQQSLQAAMAAGVLADRLAVDPGIGFGKDAAGNLEILRRLEEFRVLGRPILIGTSRKSFIGKILGLSTTEARLFGSNATVALGVARGANIFRVHDVRAARETALMSWAISHGESPA